MGSDTDGPPADIRLLERLEAHLESPETMGVDLGDARAVLAFLARLPMEDVEALVREAFDDTEYRRVLGLVEHQKGLLPANELPGPEARQRAEALAAMRRRAKEHAKERRGR